MDKRIVLPGEKIAEGRIRAPNTYIDGDSTYAAVIGMLDDKGRYIALENRYGPSMGDIVVGMVTDVRHAGYEVDLNLPEGGFISTRMMKIKLDYGDFVVCKIREVTETRDVELSEVRRLPKGKIIAFPAAKVPRLIGRKSSMINMLKEFVGGDIVVGNNGYVWMSEKCDIPLLLKTIDLIEVQAHTSGLTDRVKELLETTTGRTMPEMAEEENFEEGEMNG
ncbi:MAG: KH domain-containing protein [Candidatus Micrarchaeota archaeon]